MKELVEVNESQQNIKWPFWIQLPTIVIMPIVLIWTNIPTNILNSNDTMLLFDSFGLVCHLFHMFACFPIGIIGLVQTRKKERNMKELRLATIVLAWINLGMFIIIVGFYGLLILGEMSGAM